jgi:exonuclease III
MNRRESSSWHLMTLKYGLFDAWRLDNFRKLSRKEFTFDNGRPGASLAVSRIDKFLVSQSVEERGGRIKASSLVRKLSDHSPFVILVWGKQQEAPGNRISFFASLS